ncbi:MAG: dTDP-4-dehydrorhamnose reductase [Candidatus Nanopelagicales bacterium]
MTRWLVVGGAGQLGRDLQSVLTDTDCTAMDLPDLDITDPGSVSEVLDRVAPDVVINAAAYTAVDAAEDDELTATLVNGEGPGNLAAWCADRPGTRLVQISTDYVFSGTADRPYPESAAPAPRSAYGRSKLVGEQRVHDALPDRAYVVRTAWLYGEHGANFVATMLRLEQERDEVAVVTDQVGQPTWSADLARQVRRLVEADAPAGIYHGTNAGETSWFGLTREIYRLIGADPERVQPTTTDQFPRPAPRPAYSVLGHTAWADAGLEPMRPWESALAEALPVLARDPRR